MGKGEIIKTTQIYPEYKYTLNTHWISVEDDLPCNHMELMHPMYYLETQYVVTNIQGHYYINRMLKYKGKWVWETGEPTHWIPLPELP